MKKLGIALFLLLSMHNIMGQCTPPSVTLDPVSITLCNGSGGIFEVAASAPDPLTYQWQGDQGSGFSDLPNNTLFSGVTTPTLTIISATSGLNNIAFRCVVTTTCTPSVVSNSALLNVISITATASTTFDCLGSNTGTADIVATGGTDPYTYSWSPGGETTSSISNLALGNYTCMISDANACLTTKTVSISKPKATTTQSNVNCNGGATGSAGVVVTYGTAPYSYLWSTGGTTATITNLVQGTYSCLITDAMGCSLSKTVILIQNTTLTANIYHTDVLCNGDATGNASVSASGAWPFTYTWAPIGGTLSVASNIPVGTYTCTIKDSYNCPITKTVTISEPTLLDASTEYSDALCFAEATGSANITVTGGTTPYTYLWLPGSATNALVTGLSADTFTCIATDANDCLITKTVTISQPSAVSIVSSQSDILCSGAATGSASITVTGGAPSYSYSWAPTGGVSTSATNLTAGSYSCSVMDANGCLNLATFDISESPAITAVLSYVNSCSGTAAGSANITASGGLSPYNYLWSPGGESTTSVSNLAIGNYSCTITDAYNCSSVETFTIVQATPPVVTLTVSNDTICVNSGMVSLTGSPVGGVYSGQAVSGSSFNTAIVLPGTYSVTYTYVDTLGCSGFQTATIQVDECLGVSTNSKPTNRVHIFPNPFINTTSIEVSPDLLGSGSKIYIELYDVLGQLALKEQIVSPLTTISRGEMLSGVYYYRITIPDAVAKGVLIVQ